jgi:hypothetical protein
MRISEHELANGFAVKLRRQCPELVSQIGVRLNGGEVAIITQRPTPHDARAAVKLDGDVVAELEALVAAL